MAETLTQAAYLYFIFPYYVFPQHDVATHALDLVADSFFKMKSIRQLAGAETAGQGLPKGEGA